MQRSMAAPISRRFRGLAEDWVFSPDIRPSTATQPAEFECAKYWLASDQMLNPGSLGRCVWPCQFVPNSCSPHPVIRMRPGRICRSACGHRDELCSGRSCPTPLFRLVMMVDNVNTARIRDGCEILSKPNSAFFAPWAPL